MKGHQDNIQGTRFLLSKVIDQWLVTAACMRCLALSKEPSHQAYVHFPKDGEVPPRGCFLPQTWACRQRGEDQGVSTGKPPVCYASRLYLLQLPTGLVRVLQRNRTNGTFGCVYLARVRARNCDVF